MPVINEPKLRSPKQKAADNILITIGLFVFTFFLILLTLALWGAAGTYFYNYLFTPQYASGTLYMLLVLAGVALCIFLIMLGWSQYNLRVYGNKNRRRSTTPPTLETVGALFQLKGETVALAQSFKGATLDLIEGRPVLCNYEGNCFSPADPAQNKNNQAM
ncbi:MAG: Poly-beta,6-N-acetyl-D-glucosamine biosynthesis protein PgaD [Firmicutes bacterium]|nr:Poly-beta,6-N-acetyl-D-glucosamine biosynthesis protein PgaD [Bacillota bacterium]